MSFDLGTVVAFNISAAQDHEGPLQGTGMLMAMRSGVAVLAIETDEKDEMGRRVSLGSRSLRVKLHEVPQESLVESSTQATRLNAQEFRKLSAQLRSPSMSVRRSVEPTGP